MTTLVSSKTPLADIRIDSIRFLAHKSLKSLPLRARETSRRRHQCLATAISGLGGQSMDKSCNFHQFRGRQLVQIANNGFQNRHP